MRNHCNVSVSFHPQKFRIELKIAMKTWDILKATYLIALLHISNENTAYLFGISRYIKYFETRAKYLLYGIKRGRAPPFLLRLLDSLMIGNIIDSFLNYSFTYLTGDIWRLDGDHARCGRRTRGRMNYHFVFSHSNRQTIRMCVLFNMHYLYILLLLKSLIVSHTPAPIFRCLQT